MEYLDFNIIYGLISDLQSVSKGMYSKINALKFVMKSKCVKPFYI